jgi:hypothetical protein
MVGLEALYLIYDDGDTSLYGYTYVYLDLLGEV